MRASIFAVLLASVGVCGAPAVPSPPQADADSAILAKQLKEMVVSLLPNPLFEDDKHWGTQRPGLLGRMKNDGRWYKIKAEPRNFPATLDLTIGDKAIPKKGTSTFVVRVAMDAGVTLNRQTWVNGLRIFSGETRARCRVFLTFNCEMTTRLEKSKGFVPDMVVRLKVLSASILYRDLVCEHTAGVGGEAAAIIGDVLLGIAKAVKPDLERRLVEKANAAIVKAGDTKDIRISLTDWLAGKKMSLPAKKAMRKGPPPPPAVFPG